MRAGAVLLWAVIATIVLAGLGIFGSLVLSGRIDLFPSAVATPTATPTPTPEAVVDTSYTVLVLNATDEAGLATQTKAVIEAAGWSADLVLAGNAGSTDFAETTVYYVLAEDEPAARGLAEVVGGAKVAQSDVYLPADDPATEEDEHAIRQLTLVLGLDRTESATPSPTP